MTRPNRARAQQNPCVCGHVPVHHDKRRSIPQGLMADYKVIWACGWAGCGCPCFVEGPVTAPSSTSPAEPGRATA